MKHFEKTLSAFAGCRVGVVGDLMLDRYVWGSAGRLSQEAPVPVVRVREQTHALGGAANVARNIASLGGKTALFGGIGGDAAGQTLLGLLHHTGINSNGVQTVPDRLTTTKERVVAGHQQVVRVDREETEPFQDEVTTRCIQDVTAALQKGELDALILEDYAKGLLSQTLVQELVREASKNGVITALDPHPAAGVLVEGLDIVTPNRAEAFAMAGVYYRPGCLPVNDDTDLLHVAQKLKDDWGMGALLITLGADGMALFTDDAVPHHIPTTEQEVYDVSGAGDTVMASFVLSMVCGAPPVECCRIANHAAGIVVGRIGTAAASAEELRTSLEADVNAEDQ